MRYHLRTLLIVILFWLPLLTPLGTTYGQPQQSQPPPNDGRPSAWTITLADVGHEGGRYKLELRGDGTLQVVSARRTTAGQPPEVYYSTRVSEADLKEAYSATETLIRQLKLNDLAYSDVGRDDDRADQISIKTNNRSITIWFRGAEQERDKNLTDNLNRLKTILNRHMPKSRHYELETERQSAK
jgi:hypothetical protein